MKYRVYAGSKLIGQTDLEDKDDGMSVYTGLFKPTPAYDAFQPLFQSFFDNDLKSGPPNPQQEIFFQRLESLNLIIRKEDGTQIPTSWIQIVDFSKHIPGDDKLEINAQVSDPAILV